MSTSGQHLPSGREPGAQTREAKKRWRAAEWFGYPVAVVLIGGGLGLLFLAVRTGFDGPSYAVLKVAITGACALLCLWLGLLFLGRLVKRPLKGVTLEVVPAEMQRGESLRARVVATSEGTPPRLLVGLVASEHWEDDRGEATLTRSRSSGSTGSRSIWVRGSSTSSSWCRPTGRCPTKARSSR